MTNFIQIIAAQVIIFLFIKLLHNLCIYFKLSNNKPAISRNKICFYAERISCVQRRKY